MLQTFATAALIVETGIGIFSRIGADVFAGGGTKLVSSTMLEQFPGSSFIGNPAGTFIAPTSEIDAMLSKGLSRSEIATKLGIEDPNFLKGDLIRVDLNKGALKDLKISTPTGAEASANSKFVTGGKTIGGVTEGIVNGIPVNGAGVNISKVPKL